MKSAVIISLLLIFTGILVAQIPTSGPAGRPAATQAAFTQPVATSLPDSQASALPGTLPSAGALPVATSGPATSFSTTTQATTSYATTRWRSTTSFATSGPATRSYSAPPYSFSRRDYRPIAPASPAAAPTGPVLTPRPIGREYQPVLSRSIFIKGAQYVRDYGSRSGNRPPDTSSTTYPTTSTAPTYWSPESTLVFNGAAREESGRMVAFVENTGLNQITRFQVGDALAQGKVVGITLDGLDYQAGSKVTHVLLGQNLLGVDVQVLTTQPVTAATTSPSGTGGASGAVEDIAERLRRRRMQELGGGK